MNPEIQTQAVTPVQTSRLRFGFSLHGLGIGSSISPLILSFGIIVLIVNFADSIMAYATPVFLEAQLGNSSTMGWVMAMSSVVGLTADLLMGDLFRGRKFQFFMFAAVIFALLFPITLNFLPPIVPFFILAVAFWGIYYEMLRFANYLFIQSHAHHSEHAMAWGLIATFQALAHTIGPLLAAWALNFNHHLPFLLAIGTAAIGMLAYLSFNGSLPHHKKLANLSPETTPSHRPHLLREFRVWRVLFHKIWHLLLFLLALSLVDSTFWTVGTLLSEELKDNSEHGLVLVLYGLPAMFLGVLAGRAAKPFGKKRAAFGTALIAGVFLVLAGISKEDYLLLSFIFIASSFLAVSWPEIYAVFEDYVCRLGKTATDFIGLQSSAISISYIIGPIIAGTIAETVGNRETFAVVGGILIAVSAFAMVAVPRKIHMPQQEIKALS